MLSLLFNLCILFLQGPPKPMNIIVTRINETAMSITWTLIPITLAQGKILHYIVTYSVQHSTGQANISSVNVSANKSTVTIGGLQPDISYIVTVSAATSVGEGNSSKPMIVEPLDNTGIVD